MPSGQFAFQPEASMNNKKGQEAPQALAEFARAYDAQTHEILNAIAAAVINAEAALNWLRARPMDVDGVERALNSIISDGRRASEIVVRLRAEALKVSR